MIDRYIEETRAYKAFEDDASSKELEELRQENDELAKTLGRTIVDLIVQVDSKR